MKSIRFLLLTAAALFAGRSPGFCTANAAAAETPPAIDPAIQAQLDELKAQRAADADKIAELQRQLETKNARPAEAEDTSALALLAKGAGVDLSDVRWRVQAGLDPEQAVQAAVNQKHSDARKAAAAKDARKKK